jgi:hypothetical protein
VRAHSTDGSWPGFTDEGFLRILAEDDVEALAYLTADDAKKRRFQELREETSEIPVSSMPRRS